MQQLIKIDFPDKIRPGLMVEQGKKYQPEGH